MQVLADYLSLAKLRPSPIPAEFEIKLCSFFPTAWIMVRHLASFHHENTVHHRPIHLSSVAFLSLLVVAQQHEIYPSCCMSGAFFQSFIFIAVYYAVTMKYSHVATLQAITMNWSWADLKNKQLLPIFLPLVTKLKWAFINYSSVSLVYLVLLLFYFITYQKRSGKIMLYCLHFITM